MVTHDDTASWARAITHHYQQRQLQLADMDRPECDSPSYSPSGFAYRCMDCIDADWFLVEGSAVYGLYKQLRAYTQEAVKP